MNGNRDNAKAEHDGHHGNCNNYHGLICPHADQATQLLANNHVLR